MSIHAAFGQRGEGFFKRSYLFGSSRLLLIDSFTH